MSNQSYTAEFTVEDSPERVFAAVTNVSDCMSSIKELITTGVSQTGPKD